MVRAVFIDYMETTVVGGAHGAGIRPVLLLRGRARQHNDADAADDLNQALELVFPKG